MKNKYWLHGVLFFVTFCTTTMAGVEFSKNKYLFFEDIMYSDILSGLCFSVPFILFLTVHEFGHYFTAKYYKIKATLPFFIPFWFFGFMPSIGTMGAIIKIKDRIRTKRQYFDIGISGPLAGFVVALVVMWYGFASLPPQSYIYEIHPEYEAYESIDAAVEESDAMTFKLGGSLIFLFFKHVVADASLLPHDGEIFHYPWILAGYLALFFTALNLLPFGQLDGGHILFALVGKKRFDKFSKVVFSAFLFYAGIGFVTINDLQILSSDEILNFLMIVSGYVFFLYMCAYSLFSHKKNRLLFATSIFVAQFFLASFFDLQGYNGWLLFCLMIGRFIGVAHPDVSDKTTLGTERKVLGWLAILIFILCFSPEPLIVE